jgi:hypothetical protein
MKVFIAGSRWLSRLSADVRSRLDTIIEKGFTILIGDANGADKAVTPREFAVRNLSGLAISGVRVRRALASSRAVVHVSAIARERATDAL